MGIQYDLLNNNTSSATKYGVRLTSSVIVNELALAPAAVQLDNAIAQVGKQVGSTHWNYPDYKCTSVDAVSIGPQEVQINYVWEYRFPDIQYELSSSLTTGQTNMDVLGDVITTTYTYPDAYKEQPELAGEEFTTSVLVDKLIAETRLDIIRQEVITGTELLDKSKLYTGTVNSSSWTLTGDPMETWMCLGISGSSRDRGISYSVRYSFAYRPRKLITDDSGKKTISGWDAEVVFIDPRTDQPPSDATASEKMLYEGADFNQLGLV